MPNLKYFRNVPSDLRKLLWTLLFVLISNFLKAQSDVERLQVVMVIQQIQDVFEESLNEHLKTGCTINRNGAVVEWDSISGYRLSYSLIDLDLDQAEIITDESNMASIQVACRNGENCFALSHQYKKTNYYSDASIFSLPIEKKKNLILILDQLKKLSKALPR